MKIITKLSLIILLPTSAAIFIAYVFYTSVLGFEHRVAEDDYIDEVIVILNRLEIHTSEFMRFSYPRIITQWHITHDKLVGLLSNISVGADNKKNDTDIIISKVQNRAENIGLLFDKLIENKKSTNVSGYITSEISSRIGGQLIANIDTSFNELLYLKRKVNEKIVEQERYLFGVIVSFLVVLLLVAASIIIFFRRNIILPINSLLLATKKIASGDFQHSIKVDYEDEFGELATEFNIMSESLFNAKHALATLNTELEERVVKRTFELQIVNKELEAFAYSIAHDLSSPLRGVDGFSQILLDEYKDIIDEDGRHYLSQIRQASLRMGNIIQALLQLSKISRDDLSINEVNLSKTSEKIVSTFHLSEPDRNVKVSIQSDLIVQADEKLILLLLENLLANAWKYTSNKADAEICIGEDMHDGKRVFFVKDNGCGFDMQYVDKIFLPFHRLHDVSEFSGSGVGLATAIRIIMRHQGQIWAESEINKGTTIFFTLESA